ncbi:unnamed protein product [Blumeria hordei]|uniref:Uncharacterized protein n=1 Tax=Blumeria hordei TaxID=2867405 RepID=A0A383UXU5_BLUHO|nr:unnamed protein product [Blumeria hordei]
MNTSAANKSLLYPEVFSAVLTFSIWLWSLAGPLLGIQMGEQNPEVNSKIDMDINNPGDSVTPTEKALTRLTISPRPCLYPAPTLTCDQWAENLPPTKHVRFFIDTNWSDTPLGPLSNWSISLRIHIFTLFADSKASVLYWGPDKVKIYNEHFLGLACKKQTSLEGMVTLIGFPGLWEKVEAGFAEAEATGMATRIKEMEMYVQRRGFEEETYFSVNIIPMRGNSGKVEGFYVQAREITNITISERRRTMLNHMEVTPSGGENELSVIPVFKENPRDIPMAMLYTVDKEHSFGKVCLKLRGILGMPLDHPMAIQTLDLNSNNGVAPLLREAKNKILTMDVDNRFDGVKWHGFGEPSKVITIIPILAPSGFFGFTIVGANPRRPIDERYEQFMRDISSKLSAIGASVMTSEENRKREEKLQKELAESTNRIRFMAEHASIGMQYLSTDGTTIWANDEYYRLTGHPREEEAHYPLSFLDTYVPEDRIIAHNDWTRLLQGEHNISSELHLKHEYIPPSGNPEPSCVLMQSFRVTENDQLSSVIVFTTDISTFKWAQASEARKAAEASEAKRKQEEFIDLLSHELRNPLSAIFQLADTVINSFPEGHHVSTTDYVEALRSNIENANTIIMCAKHQKRIVDDVLTLSKLKYTMLSISPRPAQLPNLTRQTVTMFQQELISHKITIETVADASLSEHEIDWVMCDKLRIQQILINLLTNAIKFTKMESKREIEVRFGACLSDPRSHFPNMYWAPQQQSEAADLTTDSEWGYGKSLYLTLMVRDSGVGMSISEIQKLFTRFEQANERTSIRYGGSGLGLFVSQKLAEKQGGEIGVLSSPGTGSTFGFYVKSRKSDKNLVEHTDAGKKLEFSQPTPPCSPMAPCIIPQAKRENLTKGPVDLTKIHVLLVEDNIVNQHVVNKQLSKAGHKVYLANHGGEALEIIRQMDVWHETPEGKHLDIILMDWEMPIMDGLTCSREIRRLQMEGKINRHIEILATTANARPEQIATALDSGIDSVMVKPFLVKNLIQRMRERLTISPKSTLSIKSLPSS